MWEGEKHSLLPHGQGTSLYPCLQIMTQSLLRLAHNGISPLIVHSSLARLPLVAQVHSYLRVQTSGLGMRLLLSVECPKTKIMYEYFIYACRYVPTFNDLADQYWPHNIIVVTHGCGVIEAVNLAPQAKQGPVCVYYCGHVELSRESRENHAWTMASHKDVFHS